MTPQQLPEWIPFDEQSPTKEDADEAGEVLWLADNGITVWTADWDTDMADGIYTHWMRGVDAAQAFAKRKAPDPIPNLIADILNMEGMHPETRLLIELAMEAQRTGTMPALKALEIPPDGPAS
mgnify:CR=1 FL=1